MCVVFRYVKLCCAINVARERQVCPVDVYPLEQSVARLWGGDAVCVWLIIMKRVFLCLGADDRFSAAALERQPESHERTTVFPTGASHGIS